MGKVIQFPNSVLKELKDQRIQYSKENNEISSNAETYRRDEYTVGIPVKFSSSSRYEEYYLITYASRLVPRYDVSEYVKASKDRKSVV